MVLPKPGRTNSSKRLPEVPLLLAVSPSVLIKSSADSLVSHGTDVLYTFGAPIIGIGRNWTEADVAVSTQMIDYWYVPQEQSRWLCLTIRTSFINYLDPNEGLAVPNATAWPAYGGDGERNMLRLAGGNMTVFPDTYRQQMEYFSTQPEAFNLRKKGLESEE